MRNARILPAIRSSVGDWIFYTTTLQFRDVANLISSPDEIHERKRLADWIQREAVAPHAKGVAKYIQENEQRFLGSLIVGVYDGRPDWSPLNVTFRSGFGKIPDEQKSSLEGKLGILKLSGNEKLFAIDGQHRVAGIKTIANQEAKNSKLLDEEVTCIFVPHDESSMEGKVRTRRLFTTLNKKAKAISKSGQIALDEDDGFAIVTRQLIDKSMMFSDELEHISYTSQGSIPPSDVKSITSVVGLYEIVKDLYDSNGKRQFSEQRPTDPELESHLEFCTSYFDRLVQRCPEYRAVFKQRKSLPGDYRKPTNNHLLFRPAGQRAFARATQLLIRQGKSLNSAIQKLLSTNMDISHEDWSYILWDPIDKKMIPNKIAIAETQLLALAGFEARSSTNKRNLQALIASRKD